MEQRRIDEVMMGQPIMSSMPIMAVAPTQKDDLAKETIDTALVDREQQFFLAREIQVDRALGEPGLVGDLGDVRNAFGRTREQPLRRVEDGVVPFLLSFGLDGALSNHHVWVNRMSVN